MARQTDEETRRMRAENIRRQAEEYDADEGYEEYEDEEYDDDEAARRAGKGCLIAFLALVAVIAIAGGIFFFWLKGEVAGKHSSVNEAVTIEVALGNSTTVIGEKLEEAGLIGNSDVWKYYIKFFFKGTTAFQAGLHEIQPGTGYDDIIAILNEPPNVRQTADLRVPEGMTVMGVANAFEEAGLCSAEEFLMVADDLERFSDIRFIAALLEDFDENVFHNAEGYLFPDTYNFFIDDTTESYVRTIYEHMDSKFTDEVYARLGELDLSVREFITLASIIQQEAGDIDQQPYVSDVIWNRLGSGWSQGTLGVDVTLKYVRQYMQWTDEYWATVPRSEISYENAREYVGETLFYSYVTDDSDSRARVGLPTGPISSVSYTAMQAALYPEAKDGTTYYYFLTTLKGNYYYAATYNEHLANVDTMHRENAEYEQEQAALAAQAEQEEEGNGEGQAG